MLTRSMRGLTAALILCGFTAVLAAPAELSEVQKLKAKNYTERRASLPAPASTSGRSTGPTLRTWA